MIAKDLLNKDIVPLQTTDSGNRALNRMNHYSMHLYPVVEDKLFKGMISKYDLLDMAFPNENIDKLPLENERLNVLESEHLFDIIGKMNQHRTNTMPVINEEGEFVGLIGRDDVLKEITSIDAFKDPGGIIVIEMLASDYSMSEIAQIVENENARILATYVQMLPSSNRMHLTVKVNRFELHTIIATLERYGYEIRASFQKESNTDFLKERYDSLMNYLNV